MVLHEARITLRRFNNILNHADTIIEILDEKIARPAGSLFGVVGVVKEVMEIFRDFTRKQRRSDHDGSKHEE